MGHPPHFSSLSGARLNLLVRSGLVEAPWTELDHRYRPRGIRVARITLASGGLAAQTADDEVAHDALTAYPSLSLYDERRHFGPWLSRLVRNCALDWLYRRRREGCADLAAVSVDATPLKALAEQKLGQGISSRHSSASLIRREPVSRPPSTAGHPRERTRRRAFAVLPEGLARTPPHCARAIFSPALKRSAQDCGVVC